MNQTTWPLWARAEDPGTPAPERLDAALAYLHAALVGRDAGLGELAIERAAEHIVKIAEIIEVTATPGPEDVLGMRYLPAHLEDPARPGWLHPDELRRRRGSWQKCKARDDMYAQIHSDPSARCALCWSRDTLVIDHVVPLARGGTNADCNLQILCVPCNTRKGAML